MNKRGYFFLRERPSAGNSMRAKSANGKKKPVQEEPAFLEKDLTSFT
jgi:hypothetical protein